MVFQEEFRSLYNNGFIDSIRARGELGESKTINFEVLEHVERVINNGVSRLEGETIPEDVGFIDHDYQLIFDVSTEKPVRAELLLRHRTSKDPLPLNQLIPYSQLNDDLRRKIAKLNIMHGFQFAEQTGLTAHANFTPWDYLDDQFMSFWNEKNLSHNREEKKGSFAGELTEQGSFYYMLQHLNRENMERLNRNIMLASMWSETCIDDIFDGHSQFNMQHWGTFASLWKIGHTKPRRLPELDDFACIFYDYPHDEQSAYLWKLLDYLIVTKIRTLDIANKAQSSLGPEITREFIPNNLTIVVERVEDRCMFDALQNYPINRRMEQFGNIMPCFGYFVPDDLTISLCSQGYYPLKPQPLDIVLERLEQKEFFKEE